MNKIIMGVIAGILCCIAGGLNLTLYFFGKKDVKFKDCILPIIPLVIIAVAIGLMFI